MAHMYQNYMDLLRSSRGYLKGGAGRISSEADVLPLNYSRRFDSINRQECSTGSLPKMRIGTHGSEHDPPKLAQIR
jgi:hypothetical protein